MSRAVLYCGDALAVLRALPDASVRCCVTSPPYWGLRDYGIPPVLWGGDAMCEHEFAALSKHKGGRYETGAKVKWQHGATRAQMPLQWGHPEVSAGATCVKCGGWLGSLGLEPTPDLYVDHLVALLREVRRVLTPDGTLWLNIGDCYANDGKWGGETSGKQAYLPDDDRKLDGRERRYTGLKPKDLVMMPARVALALQADAWWLRRDIIWNKPNGMPESVRDRPSSSHEYVFLLSKSERYFYDAAAIAEDLQSGPSDIKKMVEGKDRYDGKHLHGDAATDPLLAASTRTNVGRKRAVGGRLRSGNLKRDLPGGRDGSGIPNDHWDNGGMGRNARSVWTIPVQPYRGAHFATFPEELARRCILAGTSQVGHCPECGAPWRRVIETTYENDTTTDGRPAVGNNRKREQADDPGRTMRSGVRTRRHDETVGWEPTCVCQHDRRLVPDVVLDPFGGSGTVAQVATGNGRASIYIDLNPKYLALAEQRIGPMLCERAS